MHTTSCWVHSTAILAWSCVTNAVTTGLPIVAALSAANQQLLVPNTHSTSVQNRRTSTSSSIHTRSATTRYLRVICTQLPFFSDMYSCICDFIHNASLFPRHHRHHFKQPIWWFAIRAHSAYSRSSGVCYASVVLR